MKRYLSAIALLLGLSALSNANADTQVRNAVIGGTLGAVIGSAVDHRDGALVGGLLGAVIGASLKDADEARPVHANYVPDRHYEPTRHESREPRGDVHYVSYNYSQRYYEEPRSARRSSDREDYRRSDDRHEWRD